MLLFSLRLMIYIPDNYFLINYFEVIFFEVRHIGQV